MTWFDMMERVLHVVWGPFPDIRLEKTARVVADAGGVADILCMENRGNEYSFGDVFVVTSPVTIWQNVRNRIGNRIFKSLTGLQWWQKQGLESVLRRKKYAVVHWNDLPGAVECIPIARRHGCKVVLDLHENYPYNMWSSERDAGLKSKRYNLNMWFRYERDAVRHADAVVTVCPEMSQRLVGMHGVEFSKLTTVSNAEPADAWDQLPEARVLADRFKGKTVLLYVGGLSRHRGLDVVIRALSGFGDKARALVFVVVGAGGGLEEWRRLAHKEGVSDSVCFEGHKPFSEAQLYYKIADIGVIPHHKYGQTDNTVPHKLYQNMIMGIPLLVSGCQALQSIVVSADSGLVFRPGDPVSAASCMSRLLDADLRAKFSANGRRAALDGPHSWGFMRRALLDTYASLGIAFRRGDGIEK